MLIFRSLSFNLTIMVSNTSNINKTINHISPQSLNKKKFTTYDVRNPGHGLGQVQIMHTSQHTAISNL